MEITRHFTATVLIVHGNRVLLHRHKKFGSLLPVGGHVDRDELPEVTAIREAQEEAGLAIELYNPDATHFLDVQLLVRPAHILLININEFHQHIDLLFYARAATDQVAPATGESKALQWYSRDEVMNAKLPENVRILALEALDLLGDGMALPVQAAQREIEFRRQHDDLVYLFQPAAPVNGKPAWRRVDDAVQLIFVDNHGWVTADAEQKINGIPWGIPVHEQGALPPAGEWVSKKGHKSYVYELAFVDPLLS